jgi:hypothetical protein
MRNLLILLMAISTFAISCGSKTTCSDPPLTVEITSIDTVTKNSPYEVRRYQSGSNFTVLLDSKIDTAYEDGIDTNYNNNPPNAYKVDKSATRTIYLRTNDDYIIISKGIEHKVENIIRTKLKGVRQPFANTSGGSCSVRKCSNYLTYTIDGVRKVKESGSGCYDYYVSAKEYIK